jgi:hypothetical protein
MVRGAAGGELAMKPALVGAGVLAALIAAAGGCQSQTESAAKPAAVTPQPDPQPVERPSQPPAPSQASNPHASPHKAPEREADDEADSPTGLPIQFGIMPGDYGDTKKGVLVGDVTPGTGAADAGIKADDRLMTWNGQEITDIYKWMDLMSKHKPGDVVTVGVLRDGKTIPMKVTLRARQ